MTNLLIDALFLLDIIIIFNTSYLDDDFHVVYCRKKITQRYIKGWFIIDLLAVIPLDLILRTSDMKGLVRFARIGRMYKLIKLARLLRILKILKQDSTAMKFFGNIFNSGAGSERLFMFILLFFVICHITACLWLFIAQFHNEDASIKDTWV